MIEAMKPQMALLLPRCSDNEIAELAGWSGSLEVRHGIAIPNFCKWLGETIGAEIMRRTSRGAIEAGSVGLPPMAPAEVSTVLIVLTSRTYCEQTEQIAKFFDHMLHHVVALASVQLVEFQRLCEAINEQAGAE